MNKRLWALAVLAIVIGGIILWSTVQVKNNTTHMFRANVSEANSNGITEAFNSPATNLRLTLNNLLREHTTTGGALLIALFDGADTTRAEQLLNDNENELASVIQSVYGTTAHDTFVQLWTQHMQEYENYTIARKNNDTAKMNQAKQNLQTIATKMGDLFGGVSKNLSSSTVSNMMTQHITDTLALVDAAAQGNSTQVANMAKAGYDQAGQFADTLARGMILDKPNMFQ